MTKIKELPNWLIFTFIILSLLGLFDASYLTISHFSGSELNCSLFKGCEAVTTSPYSKILGIPVALLGAIYYFTAFILSLFYFDQRKVLAFNLLRVMTVFGFLFSIWFTGVQAFIIKEWCQYCLLSALTSTLLFVLALISLKYLPFKKK